MTVCGFGSSRGGFEPLWTTLGPQSTQTASAPSPNDAPLELPGLLLSLLLALLGIVNLSLCLRSRRLELPNPSLCLLGTPDTKRGGKGTFTPCTCSNHSHPTHVQIPHTPAPL